MNKASILRQILRKVCADTSAPRSPSRRRFLGRAGGMAIATVMASVVGTPARALAERATVEDPHAGLTNTQERRLQAYRIRHQAAIFQRDLPLPEHRSNGDDTLYPNRIGSFSKGLPHNALGEVDPQAYNGLLRALSAGQPDGFETLAMGGNSKLRNPQAMYAFDLMGPDPHHLGMPAPPAFSSAEQAAEMAELYWHALTRDVPFTDYATDPLISRAADELSRLAGFHGPKVDGKVTATTLFRGAANGNLYGPYLSQFLWVDVRQGAMLIPQRIRTVTPKIDYMVEYSSWLLAQNGSLAYANQFDSTPRYIRNGRDLGEYVHLDFSYQAFLNACLILLDTRAELAGSNPYRYSLTEDGFGTFGAPHVLDMVAKAANCALKAAWYQKWAVHRRPRPEAFGGAVHLHKTGGAQYPVHEDTLSLPVLDTIFKRHGSYLLPMAYVEGSPFHPAYPSGHASMAGACVTMLKAFFNENYVILAPVIASADGLKLNRYVGPELTVGGELNKLAANIAIGRDWAGVHWRSDAIEGMQLGEAVAIGILADAKACFNEQVSGFSLTLFDGTPITI